MTIRELKSYKHYKIELEDLEERVRSLEAKATSLGGGIVGGAKGKPSAKNAKEDIWALLIDTREMYLKKLKELNRRMVRIEYTISRLPARERDIMRRKFIDCATNEEIGNAVGYSERQVRRIVKNALEELKIK